MSWTEIRARAGTDILSDSINSLIAQANMSEAIRDQITISDKISPITIIRSKLTVSDVGMMTCVAKPRNDEYVSFMPFEPDGKYTRLDLKFDHGGEYLTDYSYMNNETEFGFDTKMPVLIKGSYDDGVTPGKISSILDGVQHYYRAALKPKISIKQMVTDGFPGFSFIYRNFPLSILNMQRSEDGQRAIVVDYIENDSVQYAIRVEFSDDGKIYYYVRHNYQDYYLYTADSVVVLGSNIPNYFQPDYDGSDYDADTEQFQIIYPIAYQDFGFTFNFSTKVMQIYRNGLLIAETPTSVPAIPQLAKLSLYLPGNEGNGQTLRDISGLNNNGSFSANITSAKPTWISQNSRRYLSLDYFDYVTIPNSASLNTITSITISFFIFPKSDYRSGGTDWKGMVGKGYAGFGNGSWLIYGDQGNSGDVNFEIKNNTGTTAGVFGTNNIPTTQQWYHIVGTYDGTNIKLYVNGTLVGTTAAAGYTMTASTPITIGGSTGLDESASALISHVMIWKNQALTAGEIATLASIIQPQVIEYADSEIFIPANTPPFPPGFDEPATPPPPGTPYQQDFEKIYDNPSVVAPVVIENLKINKITVSDVVSIYNVAKGTPVSDPYVPVYDVPQGIQTDTTTTSPVTTVYTNPGSNSHGAVDSGKVFYGQRILNTNSDWYNKVVTDVTMYLTSSDTGSCAIGILKNDGVTFIQFGAAFDASTIDTPDKLFNRTNFTHGYALQVGDAIGVKVADSSILVEIQRAAGHVDVTGSTPDSCQSRSNFTAGDWSNNTNFSMAGIFKDGGVATGSIVVPYVQISNAAGGQYLAGEVFPTNSPMINNKPHKVEATIWRDTTIGPGTPTVSLYHYNAAGAIKATLKTVNVSTLPTTDPAAHNFTWEDPAYDNAILAGERLVIGTVGLTTGKVKVKFNNGMTTGAQNYDTTRSYLVTRNASAPQGWNSTPANDWTAKIYTGGNDFVPYIRLDHNRKRVGIKAATAGSDFIGVKPTKVDAIANKNGAPIDAAMYCRIRAQDGTLRETIGQLDTSGIADTDTPITFVNTGNNYAMALGDLITIEYDLGTATDYIEIAINKNQFDAADTILFEALAATINTASSVTDRDFAGQVYIGGSVDPVARPARGFKINNNSVALTKAVTEIRVMLKRTGTFGALDKITCKIIKWTTKASVITIAEKLCNDISNSSFVEYIFQNTANAYPFEVGDLILFEQNNGNSVTQYIEIQTSKPVNVEDAGNKDGIFTAMFEYNGQTYADDLLRDVIGSLWIGGFMVYPDPSIPNPPDPYHYFHGWHFSASTTPDSGGIIDPSLLKPKEESYFNNIADQFRLYSKILTQEQFFNYFNNKWTTTPIGFGGPQVMGYDFVPYDEAL